jgi:predicted GNAT family acetyltransferase
MWSRLRGIGGLRLAGPGDWNAALAFAKAAGPQGVLLGARLIDRFNGAAWLWPGSHGLKGVCWVGGIILPVGFGPENADLLAARAGGGIGTSLVGDAPTIMALWQRLAPSWPQPRDIRPEQPLMEINDQPLWPLDRSVRPARLDEVDQVLPAAAAMFTEEVGFAELANRQRSRVGELIRQGRTFIRWGPIPGQAAPGVQFKADLGAVVGDHAQIQGVWTHPSLRGRGLAKSGTAAVVAKALQAGYRSVSLYVNSYNLAALAVYRAVGFRQVGLWATVMV